MIALVEGVKDRAQMIPMTVTERWLSTAVS